MEIYLWVSQAVLCIAPWLPVVHCKTGFEGCYLGQLTSPSVVKEVRTGGFRAKRSGFDCLVWKARKGSQKYQSFPTQREPKMSHWGRKLKNPWEFSVSHSVVSTLCDPMNCSLPGSSVHGILKARILVWVAIPFSRASSQPRDQTCIPCIAGGFFTIWATREAGLR